MALQSLVIPIVTALKASGINQTKAALGGLTRTFDGLAKNIGAAAGSFAAFQAISGGRAFLLQSIEATQQFERNLLALNQVFEGVSPQLRAFTREVESYGISQNQAAQASVFIGSVLKQYGFEVDQAADATERIVKLAQDLATTYGYDVQEALLAVTALFRGEFDPIEKFGVAMKQNEINAELVARGFGNLTGAARENQEAIITLDFLFQRASDAVGAFARAQDTLYVAQKQLAAGVTNLQLEFGEPLQRPLAELTDIFTQLVEKHGPELVDIADAIAMGISDLNPLVESLGELFFQTTIFLSKLISPIAEVAEGLTTVLAPAFDFLAGAIEDANILLDAFRVSLLNLDKEFELIDLEDNFLTSSRTAEFVKSTLVLGDFFNDLMDDLEDYNYTQDEAAVEARNLANDFKRLELQARRNAETHRELMESLKDTTEALEPYEILLKNVGIASRNLEGEISGLAKLLAELQEEAEKSTAAKSLEKIGFEAGQIEAILTRPDWAEIFGQISEAAAIASLDIGEAISTIGAGAYYSAQAIIAALLRDIEGAGGGPAQAVKDFVGDFYDSIEDEVAKEGARRKLKAMGATEGLIESILGAQGWQKVFADVLRGGIDGLEKLQEEFNKTRKGIEELTEAAEEFAESQRKALQDAQDEIDRYAAKLAKEAEDRQKEFEDLEKAANDFKERIKELSTISILPNAAEEIGKFENAVIGSVDRIRNELRNAFQRDLIYQEDFDAISAFVEVEEFALRRLAQQRDDLAKRYALSDALINDYKRALTGALSLTNLFARLKGGTQDVIVTETTQGVRVLGNELREFGLTVTRSYKESFEEVQDKTAGLLQGFREMAEKARGFANNLRKLKELGLDPLLFNQLVQAGVEAGGETAQALVDGGADTITEINGLFTEINSLGADLGEEVAATLYGSGIDMTNGLLAGIQSQQEELLALARSMAEAFSAEFQARINIAVDKPVQVAKEVAEKAGAAAEQAVTANAQALADIDRLISGAQTALAGQLSTKFRAGVEEKLGAFQALRTDILAGQVQDISAITKGLTSAEVENIARGTGGTTVNNYYLEVKADTRTSGAKAGEAAFEALQTFGNQNGNFSLQVNP